MQLTFQLKKTLRCLVACTKTVFSHKRPPRNFTVLYEKRFGNSALDIAIDDYYLQVLYRDGVDLGDFFQCSYI